uniref:radical SAM protein n=1 Tax=Streptomyces sp. YIM 98790 TaxID=2689077 RepID=UPI00140DF3A5
MELGELIALRPQPAAGLLITLTRRCPLRCAHCSTASVPGAEDTPAPELRRFVGGFTTADRPEVQLLTGGEPLLRPGLVAGLAAAARRAGTRTALLSGMFFAGDDGALPPAVARAVRCLDHFSASLDAFHEREVPRRGVFRALHRIRDLGIAVSLHITGRTADDPYLREVTGAVRREFRDSVPMLVTTVRPVGRAAAWAAAGPGAADGPEAAGGAGPEPCAMAAWPTVAFDGTVLACCNQHAVDRRPVPGHLRLGHIAEDPWHVIRRRCRNHPVLRVIRTAGPGRPVRGGPPAGAPPCTRCRALSADPR